MTNLTAFERRLLFAIEKDRKVLEIKDKIIEALKNIWLDHDTKYRFVRGEEEDVWRVFEFFIPRLLEAEKMEFKND